MPAPKLLLPQDARVYYRWPRLVPRAPGVALDVLAWRVGVGEQRLRVILDEAGDVCAGSEEWGPLLPAALGYQLDGGAGGPALAATLGTEAAHGGWSVHLTYADGRSTVCARDPSGAVHRVWTAFATAAAPTVFALSRTEALVAFHHNLREDTEEPDLAKWIALRRVLLDGSLWEPTSVMPDRSRDARDAQQSFEFPALWGCRDGAVVLAGRGSHGVYRQLLSASGFSAREPLDDGHWGCRGRHLSVCELRPGVTGIAWRAKEGIVLSIASVDAKGPAPWRPARVAYGKGRTARRASFRARRDPAATHGYVTLFGDIQQHSAHSDGLGTADEPYLRARFHYRDDFCALTDHESFLGKRTSPGEWAELTAAADRWNEDGAFMTLVAYEWTGRAYPGPGHKCVYHREAGHPIVSRDEVPEGGALVRAIAAQGAVTGPHHTGWTGADLQGHEPVGQPFWEICSCHGCYEHAGHVLGQRGTLSDQCVDAALRRGLRFGFIANSDGHGLLWHHGEARKRDPFRTGLTAVQATGRTRQAVFDALRTRRCYATSGAPILLDLAVNGAPMGSELPPQPALTLRCEVVGTAPLSTMTLVGPEGALAAQSGQGKRALTWETKLETTPYVYLRVTQEDGEMAWSSPVFIDAIP